MMERRARKEREREGAELVDGVEDVLGDVEHDVALAPAGAAPEAERRERRPLRKAAQEHSVLARPQQAIAKKAPRGKSGGVSKEARVAVLSELYASLVALKQSLAARVDELAQTIEMLLADAARL